MKVELAGGLDTEKFWKDVRTELERTLPTDKLLANWTLRVRPFEKGEILDDEHEIEDDDWGVETDPKAEIFTIAVPSGGVGDLTSSAAAELIVSIIEDTADEDDDNDDDDDDAADDEEDADDDT